MKNNNLAETLFSAYRRQVLALLLLHPEEHYHVREISRLTGVPAGSLHRELKLLAEAGMLVWHAAGNQVRYQANRDCPIFEELASIFRKTSGLTDVVREALLPLTDQVDFAFIFGSVAQGKERVTSDVDLFVIGSVPFSGAVQALSETHQRLGREINPVVMPRVRFLEKIKAGEQFVRRVMDEPKIFILGEARDLGELVKDRAA
ncbi:MAG: DNA polymerase subunit beta [Geobacteraceae bacterium GWC2_58_44]|nr:MAG: DNA polymerase subunit beta [Geobacteraceae bacterium GWC2_58_44]HBG05465.1 DNA polymerase subunit beta [Geobacter sp.]